MEAAQQGSPRRRHGSQEMSKGHTGLQVNEPFSNIQDLAEAANNVRIHRAFLVSVVSVAVSTLVVILGTVFAAVGNSPATLGLALENAVDVFSSALVCWRFWGGGNTTPVEVLDQREKKASIAIAMAFIVLAMVVMINASVHVSHQNKSQEAVLLIALAAPCVVIFTVLGIIKIRLGQLIPSASLTKDGACSLLGALLSAGILVGTSVTHYEDDGFWWFDAVLAIVASCGLLAYGVLNLVKNGRQGHAFWRKSWWMAPIEPSAQLQHSLIGLPDEDEDVIFAKDEHVGGVRQSHGSVAAQSTNSAAFSQSSEADIGDAGRRGSYRGASLPASAPVADSHGARSSDCNEDLEHDDVFSNALPSSSEA